MSAEDYLVFSQFLQNVQSMCLFIASTDFHRRSEHMLNTLVKVGHTATLQVRNEAVIRKPDAPTDAREWTDPLSVAQFPHLTALCLTAS
jgi:hypothetical protein